MYYGFHDEVYSQIIIDGDEKTYLYGINQLREIGLLKELDDLLVDLGKTKHPKIILNLNKEEEDESSI